MHTPPLWVLRLAKGRRRAIASGRPPTAHARTHTQDDGHGIENLVYSPVRGMYSSHAYPEQKEGIFLCEQTSSPIHALSVQ